MFGGTKLNADKMTLAEAKKITKKLPKNKNLLPVGSVASEQPYPQDLDFLTMENLSDLYKLFVKKYPIVWKKVRLGQKRFDYYPIIDSKKIVINIWKVTDENLPFMYLAYGYPRGFSIALKKKAKNMGYKLSSYGLFKGKDKLERVSFLCKPLIHNPIIL